MYAGFMRLLDILTLFAFLPIEAQIAITGVEPVVYTICLTSTMTTTGALLV